MSNKKERDGRSPRNQAANSKHGFNITEGHKDLIEQSRTDLIRDLITERYR